MWRGLTDPGGVSPRPRQQAGWGSRIAESGNCERSELPLEVYVGAKPADPPAGGQVLLGIATAKERAKTSASVALVALARLRKCPVGTVAQGEAVKPAKRARNVRQGGRRPTQHME